jgi:hypothetical protein
MSIESIEHRLDVELYAIHSGTDPNRDLRLLLAVAKAAKAEGHQSIYNNVRGLTDCTICQVFWPCPTISALVALEAAP